MQISIITTEKLCPQIQCINIKCTVENEIIMDIVQVEGPMGPVAFLEVFYFCYSSRNNKLIFPASSMVHQVTQQQPRPSSQHLVGPYSSFKIRDFCITFFFLK